MRILVTSLPKSGTFLLGEVLKLLGYHDTGDLYTSAGNKMNLLNWSKDGIRNHKKTDLISQRVNYLQEELQMIPFGYFSKGHFDYSFHTIFNKIPNLIVLPLERNIESAKASYIHFHQTLRGVPPERVKADLERVYSNWQHWPGAMKFEDIVCGIVPHQLRKLGATEELLQEALLKDNLTRR